MGDALAVDGRFMEDDASTMSSTEIDREIETLSVALMSGPLPPQDKERLDRLLARRLKRTYRRPYTSR